MEAGRRLEPEDEDWPDVEVPELELVLPDVAVPEEDWPAEPELALEAAVADACAVVCPENESAARMEKTPVAAPAAASVQRVILETFARPASRAVIRWLDMFQVS